jgi:PTH2 family peptidyl-tRNA hydrolase
MSPGKIASQTAHAAVCLYIQAKYERNRKHFLFLNEIDTWVKLGQKKVVLKGLNDLQLNNLGEQANNMNLISIKIKDAGRTQVEPGSLTCLGIFGKEDDINKITSSLTLL